MPALHTRFVSTACLQSSMRPDDTLRPGAIQLLAGAVLRHGVAARRIQARGCPVGGRGA